MNAARLRETADFIEALDQWTGKLRRQFDMGTFGSAIYGDGIDASHECGTAACVAGWRYLMDHQAMLPIRSTNAHYVAAHAVPYARDILELDTNQADYVFFRGTHWYPNAQQAAALLRCLADTGRARWSDFCDWSDGAELAISDPDDFAEQNANEIALDHERSDWAFAGIEPAVERIAVLAAD